MVISTKQIMGGSTASGQHASTGVVTEQNEESERGAVGGSDVRNDGKAPGVEGRPCVEDSMDWGEEILGDTNGKVECQPLLRQPQEDKSTTTEAREEEERGRGKQEIRSGEWWRIALKQSRR